MPDPTRLIFHMPMDDLTDYRFQGNLSTAARTARQSTNPPALVSGVRSASFNYGDDRAWSWDDTTTFRVATPYNFPKLPELQV